MSRDLPPLPLPSRIRSTYIDCTSSCGLNFHVLEAGHSPEDPSIARSKPLLVLLHGYPEIAFSWRRLLTPLAAQGYHVVAPDQRGSGRTTGWDNRPYEEVDMTTFKVTQLIADVVSLVYALGHTHVHCLIGHDFGAFVTGMAALARPDLFKSIVLMSHPFKGAPAVPFNVADPTPAEHTQQEFKAAEAAAKADLGVHAHLADLGRKHYQWYNASPPAAKDWYCDGSLESLRTFLRGYIHLKSGDWAGNEPHPLQSWTASELAKLPHYYVMPLNSSMSQTIADDMRGEDYEKTRAWLSDEDLDVYVQEWRRIGFQGALNWYRSNTDKNLNGDLVMLAGRKIEVPAVFVTGEKDWGKEQSPGVWEGWDRKYGDFRGRFDVKGGHWPQQEDSVGVLSVVGKFLKDL